MFFLKGSLFSLNAPGVFLPPPHQQAGVPPNFLLSLHFSFGLCPTPGPIPGYLGEGGLLSRQAEWELLASRPRPPVALGTRHVGYVGPTAAVGNSLPMSTTAQPASCLPRTPGIQGLWPGCGFAEPSPPQGLSVTQDDYSNRGNDTFPSVIFYRPEQL